MLASIRELRNLRAGPGSFGLGRGHRTGAGFEVRFGQARFFGSDEGSITERIAPKQ